MPILTVPEAESLNYYLIAFDAEGNERQDDPDGLMSQHLIDALKNSTQPITDVFIFSHGWLGDIQAAINQYDKWTKIVYKQQKDRDRIRQLCPQFNPLLIGFHWPSKPWGNEELSPSEDNINRYTERIAKTDKARDAIQTILTAASENLMPERLSGRVVHAYRELQQEANLKYEGIGSAPGADLEDFDALAEYQQVKEIELESDENRISILGGLLAPLRTLSFWQMKNRARQIGETAGFKLLKDLQETSYDDVNFHLMGHSFGSIVVSATLSGSHSQGTLIRPVNSVALVQGALSIWSYCPVIPILSQQTPGYFHNIIAENKVNGPIITTQSRYDTALSRMYPLGAGLANQVDYDLYNANNPPKYRALGHLGARGLSPEKSVFMKMLPTDSSYQFEPGVIYNLNSDRYICELDGMGGAHSDIDKPEVAHAIWEAAIAGLCKN